jgi:hypothetical protein
VVLDLVANVEPQVVEDVAREIAARLERSPVPHRLIVTTGTGDVSLAVEISHDQRGCTVTLRRTG